MISDFKPSSDSKPSSLFHLPYHYHSINSALDDPKHYFISIMSFGLYRQDNDDVGWQHHDDDGRRVNQYVTFSMIIFID